MLAFVGMIATAQAEEYPTQPIHLITGFPAGSIVDTSARVIGAKMSALLGQQIVVENRPGAGSSIAAAQAARGPKDGFIRCLSDRRRTSLTPAMKQKSGFQFLRRLQFDHADHIHAHRSNGHASARRQERSRTRRLCQGQSWQVVVCPGGYGSAAHLALELFESIAGVDIVHVPYPGSPQALTDIFGGVNPGNAFFPPRQSVATLQRGSFLRSP